MKCYKTIPQETSILDCYCVVRVNCWKTSYSHRRLKKKKKNIISTIDSFRHSISAYACRRLEERSCWLVETKKRHNKKKIASSIAFLYCERDIWSQAKWLAHMRGQWYIWFTMIEKKRHERRSAARDFLQSYTLQLCSKNENLFRIYSKSIVRLTKKKIKTSFNLETSNYNLFSKGVLSFNKFVLNFFTIKI